MLGGGQITDEQTGNPLDGLPLQLLFANGQARTSFYIEVELRVPPSATWVSLAGRQQITAAPFALATPIRDGQVVRSMLGAGAVGSTEIDTSQVQQRITGTCGQNEAVSGVNANGQVQCSPLSLQVSVTYSREVVATGNNGNDSVVLGADDGRRYCSLAAVQMSEIDQGGNEWTRCEVVVVPESGGVPAHFLLRAVNGSAGNDHQAKCVASCMQW